MNKLMIMKRILSFALAVSTLLSACQMEEFAEPINENDELYASVEEFVLTRTQMGEGRSVLWSDDDRIVVFNKYTQGTQYKVKAGGKTTASFSVVHSDDMMSGSKLSHVIAYYPYSESIECASNSGGYSMNVVLPELQTYVEKSFGNGALPMAAVSEDNNLAFKNVCGVMKLQLKGDIKVASVKVEGKNNEKLSGPATLTVYTNESKPSIEMDSDASVCATLTCGDGVQLDADAATEFIISLPPVKFTKGFIVTVTDASGAVYTVETSKTGNEIKRSAILAMPQITLDASHREPMEGDYIDEYGVNQGQGVKIGETIWAPVNCGYHETDFKYGKLYQWGRKYGQGYKNKDASFPVAKMQTVSLDVGQSVENQNVLYYNFVTPEDWLSPQNNKLWNLGSTLEPIKTEYDPCPEGWRVPTSAELREIIQNTSSWTTNDTGQNGYWLTGSNTYDSNTSRIFLPAAGYYDGRSGYAQDRNAAGLYWDSDPSNIWSDESDAIYFTNNSISAAVRSRAYALSIRCVKDDAELIEVSSVSLDAASKIMSIGESAFLSATITPSNANHKNAFWYSSDETVATVDQTGKLTAVGAGTTIITAMAGMQTATCEVTVRKELKDYVDEYGENHGTGTMIDDVIWAPVNCGFHETNFKYGKLYQWGRKYGQGYEGSDTSVPTIKEGGVSASDANLKDNENVFYTGISSYGHNWAYPHDSTLWNSASDSSPLKTDYDPCPTGWRVPTYAELSKLCQNYSDKTTKNDQSGYWFSGTQAYSASVSRIFLPLAGNISSSGFSGGRNEYGYYWSSYTNQGYIFISYFLNLKDLMDMDTTVRSNGYSIRCVQE